jgi:hypothetical protein
MWKHRGTVKLIISIKMGRGGIIKWQYENSREPKPRPTNINITKFIESSKYYKKKGRSTPFSDLNQYKSYIVI